MSCATKALPESRPLERPEVPAPYNVNGELCVSYNPDTDRVSMAFFYWKKVLRYIIDAEAALDIAESRIQELESEKGPVRP